MDYKELITIKEKYNKTDQEAIKTNIKSYMKAHNVKHSLLSELLSISLHTSYSYTNAANKNKPDLYNLLILSDFFNVSIQDIFNID
jgi:hypothetical protein